MTSPYNPLIEMKKLLIQPIPDGHEFLPFQSQAAHHHPRLCKATEMI
jgi:hypothetical protein